MTYQYVQCPNFVRKAPSGALEALQCKLCGAVIADTIERVTGYEVDRGGNRVKIVNRQFTRFANFTEIKILFNDGSMHVTTGCSKCLNLNLRPAVLDEMHQADQEESPDGYTDRERARRAVHVTTVRVDQSGIP